MIHERHVETVQFFACTLFLYRLQYLRLNMGQEALSNHQLCILFTGHLKYRFIVHRDCLELSLSPSC
jgi:hypothetical protein